MARAKALQLRSLQTSYSSRTETDPSIIGLALINGVVRTKPTVGLTSRAGVIPISRSMDTVGSFGRTVVDAVHGLNAIVGKGERDTMTCFSSRLQEKDYCKYLTTKVTLKVARFGLPKKRFWDFVTKDIKEKALRISRSHTGSRNEHHRG